MGTSAWVWFFYMIFPSRKSWYQGIILGWWFYINEAAMNAHLLFNTASGVVFDVIYDSTWNNLIYYGTETS